MKKAWLSGGIAIGITFGALFFRRTPTVPSPSAKRIEQQVSAPSEAPLSVESQSSRSAQLPSAMSDPASYCTQRLKEIKAAPEPWRYPQNWRAEFDAAPNDLMRAEVVGLARQVDPKAFLAVLARALEIDDFNVRLSAARHIAQLPESLLSEGIGIGMHALDAAIREEVLNVASNSLASLRPTLLGVALRSSPFPETRLAAADLLLERPEPAGFEALLPGLDDKSPEVRSSIQKRIENQVGQHFETAESAQKWWGTNRDRFDSMLLQIPGR